jgi:4-alpha-glucanotransferase
MNLPASDSGNWHWRFQTGDVTDKIAARLHHLVKIYGREPQEPQPKN